jgi:hypothetical protein
VRIENYSLFYRITAALISRFVLDLRWVATGGSKLSEVESLDIPELYASSRAPLDDDRGELMEKGAQAKGKGTDIGVEMPDVGYIEEVITAPIFILLS